MKFVGGLLVLFSISLFGIFLGERKKCAANECEAFLDLANYIKIRIEYFNMPTKLILNDYENDYLSQMKFIEALRQRQDDDVYYNALKNTFIDFMGNFSMSDNVKETILSFASVVGKGGAEQLPSMNHYISELEKLTAKQRAEAERDAKLYAILGLAIGSAVMIMLI